MRTSVKVPIVDVQCCCCCYNDVITRAVDNDGCDDDGVSQRRVDIVTWRRSVDGLCVLYCYKTYAIAPCRLVKAKFHYAILVADRFEAGHDLSQTC